jgi:lysophospholipase L1-like esterase
MRLLLRLALATAGLAIGFGVVEVAVRLLDVPVGVSDLRRIHELDPAAPWLYGLRPGAVARPEGGPRYAINALGFRDHERSLRKPEGAFRVLAVGDSVTFGWGVEVEEAWPLRLEQRLRRDLPGAEVLNLGVGGYNPYTESALLRERGLAFEPDLVLVQFCINDLSDPTIHFDNHARTRLGTLPDAAFPDPARRTHDVGGRSWAEQICLASHVCRRGYDAWLARSQARLDEATRHAGARPIERTEGPEWGWLAERYREMAVASHEAGADFALLVFPHYKQLQRPAGAGPDPVHERLLELARAEGIAVVDLLPAFRRAQASGNPLLDYWHPSSRGHALAAATIEHDLGCIGMLPGVRPRDCARPATAGR